jgi:hypothetical protein
VFVLVSYWLPGVLNHFPTSLVQLKTAVGSVGRIAPGSYPPQLERFEGGIVHTTTYTIPHDYSNFQTQHNLIPPTSPAAAGTKRL